MATCPVPHTTPDSTLQSATDTTFHKGQCPVDHAKTQDTTAKCPVDHGQEKAEKCPVDPSAYHHFLPPSDGCTSETINADNIMPTISQQPLPDQNEALSQERETSTIPRSLQSDQKWVYPSEQMFFNAMRRKQWDAKEKDMSVVVPIHNAVNEQAWRQILEWESLHETKCGTPALLKFQGRPKDISPKARIRSWLGYQLPFDRHDWTVDRCGEKVTYVIDFYSGKKDPKRPEAMSFYLDVRPAVSASGMLDRLRMAWHKGSFQ